MHTIYLVSFRESPFNTAMEKPRHIYTAYSKNTFNSKEEKNLKLKSD